jgi:peptidoglycan/LPS O-acetylase OafA/YrhL
MTKQTRADRLVPLDSLRGFASLGVALFSHFQHFGGDPSRYPFRQLTYVRWLYVNSWLFVDLFFILSGIVLTFRYLEPLSTQRIRGHEFFVLRLSRLYPLHVVTLLVCAAVEWSLMGLHRPMVIYEKNNDLYHFFLHLTYMHLWFERGWAYNEPSWSVCGEIFVYLLFFLFASRRPKSYPLACIATVILGITVQTSWSLPFLNENTARAMVGFFVGSLMFQGMQRCDSAGYGSILGLVSLAALVLVSALAYWIGYDVWIGGKPLPNSLVVFPLVILVSLKVRPLARLLSVRPLAFLGDISYAVYLVHVPLQMITLSVARAHDIAIPTSKPELLWAYMAVLILVATAVHYGLERPARRWLRGHLVTRGPRAALVAPAA